MDLKTIIKNIIKLSPIALTKNHGYDIKTKKIFKQILRSDSNAIDVGCHKGEILDLILKYAPHGKHFGFEPIPLLYQNLVTKYQSKSSCTISPIAASNQKGTSSFNYVVSNPSYSGIKKRSYDNASEKDEIITVDTNLLDNLIPSSHKIDLIKIDVEGGEMLVLEGAKNIIKASQPVIVFEHGLGASDYYEKGPEDVYLFFSELNYELLTLDQFLKKESSMNEADFKKQFYDKLNYYFIARSKA